MSTRAPLPFDYDYVPVASPTVATSYLDGEAVIYDPTNHRPLLLNSTGAAVWLLVDGESTLNDIATALAEVFGVDLDDVQNQVHALVTRFGELGLLDGVEPLQELTDGRGRPVVSGGPLVAPQKGCGCRRPTEPVWTRRVVVSAGPWQVGIGFEDGVASELVEDALATSLLPADLSVPVALGPRRRAGVGIGLFFGSEAYARASGEHQLLGALGWFLASLGHARPGIGDVTDLRVLVGSQGAVLLSSTRPELLSAHAWRDRGLVELPMLAAVLDTDRTAVVLPAPPGRLLGDHSEFAGRTVPLRGIVARSADGELIADTKDRISGSFHGDGARDVLDAVADAGAFKVGGSRERLLRRVLQLVD